MPCGVLACPMCWNYYENSDDILVTNCGHVFHKQCFEEWIARVCNCPQCRFEHPTSHKIYLNVENTAFDKMKTELEQIISDLRNQLSQNLNDKEQYETNLTELQSQLDTCILNNSESENKLHEIDRNFLYMEKQYNKCDKELEEKVNEYNIKLAELQSQLDQSQLIVRDLQNQLTDSDRYFLTLQEQYNSKNEQLNELNKRKYETEVALAEFQSKWDNKLSKSEKKFCTLEERYRKAICDLEVHNQLKSNNEMTNLESQLEQYILDISILQNQLDESERKCFKLQDQQDKNENSHKLEIAKFESALDEKSSQLKNFKQQLEQSNHNHSKLRTIIVELKNMIKDQTTRANDNESKRDYAKKVEK